MPSQDLIILIVQVIAALGVVVSVIYLGLQIKQQNIITKAQFGHSLTQRLYDRYFQTSKDPEYAKYITAVLNAAYSDVMGNTQSASLDTESYEEVRQIALDIEDDEFVNWLSLYN